jgi:chemotaxis protein MotA
MDLSVLLGLIGAITSISVGVILEGGNPAGVLHISSFIIVIPTAMLAAVVATDSKYVKAAFKEFKNIFKKSPVNFEARIDELVEYAITVKKQGVLALEKDVQGLNHQFLKEALSMVVDGSKEEQIEEQLEPVIEATEEYYHGASHFWLHAGETSPTIGLVGAVFSARQQAGAECVLACATPDRRWACADSRHGSSLPPSVLRHGDTTSRRDGPLKATFVQHRVC